MLLNHLTLFYCFVDASWISPEEKAGFGWILKNPQGRPLMKGYASIDPTRTVMEAEAIA